MNIITVKILQARQQCANGYILLISVIIVGAIATSVAASLLFFGSADSKNAISHQRSEKAKALVNACAEEGLEQLRANTSFTGSGNLTLNDGSCQYVVTNTGGSTRLIVSSSTVGDVFRHASITVSALSPTISSTWQETP